MSLRMFLGEVDHQKTSMNNQHVQLIQAMEQLVRGIDEFSMDILLQAKSYDSAKHYFSQTYKTLAQGLICLSEELIRTNDNFPSNYRSEVASIDLDEDRIRDQIQQINNNLALLEVTSSETTIGLKSIKITLESLKNKLEAQLHKLQQFEYTSSNMYNTAVDLANNIVRGLSEVQNGKGWNAETGSFDINRLNMDWQTTIQANWENRETRASKAKKEREKQIIKELEDYTVYAMVFKDLDGTEKITWIIDKNGKRIDNTDLTEFLERYGSTLDPSLYKVVSWQEIYELELAAQRRGETYLTNLQFEGISKAMIQGQGMIQTGVNWYEQSGMATIINSLLLANAVKGMNSNKTDSKPKIKSEDIKFGSTAKSTKKLNRQMEQRGWSEKTVKDIADKPHTTRKSINRANGNEATVFYDKDGSYMIVDDVTKEVVQISDKFNKDWAPDREIINPYKP